MNRIARIIGLAGYVIAIGCLIENHGRAETGGTVAVAV